MAYHKLLKISDKEISKASDKEYVIKTGTKIKMSRCKVYK